MKKILFVLFVIVTLLVMAMPVAAKGGDDNRPDHSDWVTWHKNLPHDRCNEKLFPPTAKPHGWEEGPCEIIPTDVPTDEPTETPDPSETPNPTDEPTLEPTATDEPTLEPTATDEPTLDPTQEPVIAAATPQPKYNGCYQAYQKIMTNKYRDVGYRYFDTHDWCYAWAEIQQGVNVHWYRLSHP